MSGRRPERIDNDLFACLRDASLDPLRRRQLRSQAIEQHLPLVRRCVNDFHPRHDLREDIVQVGTIGLIHAVDRFDPDRGVEFPAFARPTINGEILRYFRDRGSTIRLPRRFHEVTHAARSSQEHVQHKLGREPTLADLAAFLSIPNDLMEAAFAAERACSTRSLDRPEDPVVGAPVGYGGLDPDLEAVADIQALRQCVRELPEIERRVIVMLFWEGLTQDQAALRLGRSQMYVSRALKRGIAALRVHLVP